MMSIILIIQILKLYSFLIINKGCDVIINKTNFKYFVLLIDVIDEEINSCSKLKVSEENEEYNKDIVFKIDADNFSKYNIKNINNKYEVIKKVYERLKDKYISTEMEIKKIHNIYTKAEIEIWKSGIKETFGNDKYYKNLSDEIKKAKIVLMEYLDELIIHSKKRAEDALNYHNLRSDIKFSYLRILVEINNVIYYLNIDIKKYNDINKFYIHYLQRKDFDK